jgi:hypothetical protein
LCRTIVLFAPARANGKGTGEAAALVFPDLKVSAGVDPSGAAAF